MAVKSSVRAAAVQIAPDLETAGGTVTKVLAADRGGGGERRAVRRVP